MYKHPAIKEIMMMIMMMMMIIIIIIIIIPIIYFTYGQGTTLTLQKTKEINSHQKSRLGFEPGNTSQKNPKQVPTKYEYRHTQVYTLPSSPTELHGVWRESKSRRLLDVKIK
jgi:hypothetical protein